MLNKGQVDGAPGVFVVISVFKLAREWEILEPGAQALAVDETAAFLCDTEREVAVDTYVTRGLEAHSDYFLRVRARDLAEAQRFLQDFRSTPVGSGSEPAETLVGLSKERQYITTQKSAALEEQLLAGSYQDNDPVFAIVIPVRKSPRWWNMPEAERRREVELHTQKSLPYLASVKRELYHSTGLDDLDFITYFEVADARIFHELAIGLAAIPENEFHTRWGQPTLVGAIHSIPEALSRLCRRRASVNVGPQERMAASAAQGNSIRTIIRGTER